MHLSRFFFVLSFLSMLVGSANAATYYVATTGNDANAGTATAPFATITKAAGVARAGDVVNVRGGVYSGVARISSKGTASAPIVFQSYPGETAVIDGTGTGANTDLVQISGAEYVDFTGFEVRNSTKIGILVYPGRYVRILNNTVHHSVRAGIYAGYSTFGSTSDLTIDGNTVTNNVLENQYHTWSGGWAQAIGICRAERVQVTNNRVFKNDGEGIVFILSNNGLARNNEVSDNFSVGIYLDNARYTTVDANFVYSTGDSRYFRSGYPAAGIGTANENYNDSNPLTDLTITNNIVVDTRWGFYYGAYGDGGGLKNTRVTNNTFYRSGTAMVWIQADAHAGNVVQNNIFYQAGGGLMHSGSVSGTTFRNNNWHGGNAGAAAGTGDIIGDPRFVSAGGLRTDDYRLTNLSPAIHSGLDLSEIGSDYWGSARSATYDIGAHEYSLLGGSTEPTLLAPTSITAIAQGSSAIALSWTSAANATGYRVHRNGALVATVSGTNWVDQGLAPSTTYSYTLVSFNSSSESAPSSAVSATTTAAVDAQAPSVPANAAALATSSSAITVSWNASTDNVGVAHYRVYRNLTMVATVQGTSWSDSGLAPSTTYSYAVTAVDQAGNESAASNTAPATTLPATVSDTQAPSIPSGFWASASTSAARVYLGWTASTDNVGVTGYKIYRNGAHVATVTSTTWTDDGLAYSTTYQYGVSAIDAAGNESARATANATTLRKKKLRGTSH